MWGNYRGKTKKVGDNGGGDGGDEPLSPSSGGLDDDEPLPPSGGDNDSGGGTLVDDLDSD